MLFKITDLPIAAYLAVIGMKFLGCEALTNTQAQFVFHDPEHSGPELLAAYYADAKCSARGFNREYRRLRTEAMKVVGK